MRSRLQTLAVQTIRRFLDIGTLPEPADAIFVFAGRPERKFYAFDLFRAGLADCIIFSVGRFEWRAFLKMFPQNNGGLLDLVQATYYKDRHFFVIMDQNRVECIRVARHRLGTFTEVRALVPILHQKQIKRILVVTSDFHLRRSVSILKAMARGNALEIVPVAVPERYRPASPTFIPHQAVGKKLIVQEFIKYITYRVASPVLRHIP